MISTVRHAQAREVIARNIRMFLEDSTNKEVATKLQVHEGLIAHLKRGRSLPNMATLIALADVIPGCTVKDLIEGID